MGLGMTLKHFKTCSNLIFAWYLLLKYTMFIPQLTPCINYLLIWPTWLKQVQYFNIGYDETADLNTNSFIFIFPPMWYPVGEPTRLSISLLKVEALFTLISSRKCSYSEKTKWVSYVLFQFSYIYRLHIFKQKLLLSDIGITMLCPYKI